MTPRCSHFINNEWQEGRGQPFFSENPATGHINWEGHAAAAEEIRQAMESARAAFTLWGETSVAKRTKVLETYRDQLRRHKNKLALGISKETGKPLWESTAEVESMVRKVDISIEAYGNRRGPEVTEQNSGRLAVRFKPHGVIAVIGPFNMPGHLPNGHIVPALLAGNTVVFKPSRHAPLVAEEMTRLWEAAGIPAGVLNLVQGGRESGRALAEHPDLNGLFFTGSSVTGKALHKAFSGHPERILALEMGGNNPLVVHEVSDIDAAAYSTVVSAYITSGQRCTCARRLIVPIGTEGDRFVDSLRFIIRRIRVGRYDEVPEPFMGPVISAEAAGSLLKEQEALRKRGGASLENIHLVEGYGRMLTPGLIDLSEVTDRPDVERFGPFLQLIRVAGFEAALQEANRTAYGLAAGLLSDNKILYERFFSSAKAGVINWNKPLTGASGYLPFGGVGISGNHRPSAYYAADYCSYPVASHEAARLDGPMQLVPGIDL